jgi:hypothetical protein
MTKVIHNGEEKTFKRVYLRGDGWGYAMILVDDLGQWFQVRNSGGEWSTTGDAVTEGEVRRMLRRGL